MFEKCINSKKQGDIGLGFAIKFFSSKGTVCIPLTDSQDYDLVVDDGEKLLKIQVKTTNQKIKNYYKITLCSKGGNKSRNFIKKFDKTKVDFLYCLTSEGKEYLIPSKNIDTEFSLTLGEKYSAYIVL